MNFSLLSNSFFLCVVLVNTAIVHSSFHTKVNPKKSSNAEDEANYASLAKAAFESDDPSFYKKSSKHNYSSLVKLAHELEYLSTTKSSKNNFSTLSSLAFELDDLKNRKKSDDEFGSLVKAAYELDELSDLKKDSGNRNYASIARLAFQLDDLSPYKRSDGHNYASLAKLTFESDFLFDLESDSKRFTLDSALEELKELFERLKFFTTITTSTFHGGKGSTLHHTFSDKLTPLKDDKYNVEKDLNLVDFYFSPSYSCDLVSYDNVTVWKKGDADVKVPTTMTFDLEENVLVVRDHLRHATYHKMANGSWKLDSLEVFDTIDMHQDPFSDFPKASKLPFVGPLSLDPYVNKTLIAKALNIYTEHEDNIIMSNNPEAFEFSRFGKFKSFYVFKFHSNTKCVGVEYQGKNIWSREQDDTPLLEDEYTKGYPLRVVFNTRANAIYVMFKNTYFVCIRQIEGFYLFKVKLVD